MLMRSIIGSRDLLNKGLRWRIGDGSQIKAFQHRWVPGLEEGEVLGMANLREKEMRVKELISNDGQWDEVRVREYMLPHEAQAVLNTPIGEKSSQDEQWWILENNGLSTVKLAYRLYMGYLAQHPYTSMEEKSWWGKHVWNLSIAPKAKVFLWRMFQDLIPTAGNLKMHHVPSDGICSLCKDRWDSTDHALFFCPKTRNIWKGSKFWELIKQGEMVGVRAVAEAVRKKWGVEAYEVWSLLAWKVWQYVCQLTHNDEENVIMPTMEECRALWEANYRARVVYNEKLHMGVTFGERRWRAPKLGRYRVDVDVLFNPGINAFGVGVIIRDWKGHVVSAMAKRTSPRSNVMIAEILAIVEGIIFAMDKQIAPIELYTDSILAARLMADESEDNW